MKLLSSYKNFNAIIVISSEYSTGETLCNNHFLILVSQIQLNKLIAFGHPVTGTGNSGVIIKFNDNNSIQEINITNGRGVIKIIGVKF